MNTKTITITRVTVVPADKLIIVNGIAHRSDFDLVPGHEHMHALQWDGVSQTGHIEFEDDYNQTINASLYDEEVKPYVDAWQAEKDRLDAEAAAAEAEYNKLENVKARKLSELNAGLSAARNDSKTSIDSSVGFAINADDVANTNIAGLVTYLESTGTETTNFMSFDNTLHEVTLQNLKTMQTELAVWGQCLYAYKWQIRSRIEAAESKEVVDAIDIDYTQAKAIYASMTTGEAKK